MRKLAQRLGSKVCTIAIIPTATLAKGLLYFGVESSTIITIQIPLLAIQVLGLFMLIKYHREIF